MPGSGLKVCGGMHPWKRFFDLNFADILVHFGPEKISGTKEVE